LVSGQLADKYVNTEIILAVGHLLGAVCMYLAVRQTKFKNLLVVMFCYSLCYCATLPLVNSLMFHHLAKNNLDPGEHSTWIFIWAPIGWALIAWSLTGWRWKFKTGEKGSDCLYLAAVLSVIMGTGCFFLPKTPPAGAGTAPILQAMSMFTDFNFLVFIVVSMVFFGLMQFYFLGTAPFMQDRGIPAKNVPASMGLAQAVQAIATVVLMAFLMDRIGIKWTMVVGAACWFILYVAYVAQKPAWIIIACQPFHGLAYVLFVIVGQIFANTLASDEIRGSVQSLLFAATTGVGLFAGTQFAGIIMDKFRKDDKFQWRSIFCVPCAIALVGVLVFVFFLKA